MQVPKGRASQAAVCWAGAQNAERWAGLQEKEGEGGVRSGWLGTGSGDLTPGGTGPTSGLGSEAAP